ncbi:MAG: DUF362 domain-containing protein [Candidatus Atribacteria bacterium]|nr:DUF362 domain-containing protein [Candidatus Atribacteria bacterium]
MASPVYFVSLRAYDERNSVLEKVKRLTKALLQERLEKEDLVAVKLHFGERGNHGFLKPVFLRYIVEAVKELGGKPFLTDANTLYLGFRHNAVDHLETATFHGFGYPAVPAPLIIADGLRGSDYQEVEVNLKHFKTVKIASAIQEADFLLVVTHVKGHVEAGLGGAIKNIGMGGASRVGKQLQHGETFFPDPREELCIGCRRCINHCPQHALYLDEQRKAKLRKELCISCAECIIYCNQEAITTSWSSSISTLQERMVEHAYGAVTSKGAKVAFINFLTEISPDCDCSPWHDASLVPDIGILGGNDIVAIDKASADLIKKSVGLQNSGLKSAFSPGEDKFLDVHPQANWEIQIEYGHSIGLGDKNYELKNFPK